MRRILTRYLPAYPKAVSYLLHTSGYRLREFWRRYSGVDDWTTVVPKPWRLTVSTQLLVSALSFLLIISLAWLVVVWQLLSPLTTDGIRLLAIYGALWVYAAPVLLTLVFAVLVCLVTQGRQLLSSSGQKVYLRGLVASRLEAQVVRLIHERGLLVIAVTGNVGKTSTKLAIAHVLSATCRVLTHSGNYNSEIGLPLSIFELEVPERLTSPAAWLTILRQVKRRRKAFAYDALVLELGADQPGDIGKFMRYLRPEVGILTAVTKLPVHLEQFKTPEAVLNEKWELARGSAHVLLNSDDELLMSRRDELAPETTRTYGLSAGEYHLKNMKLTKTGYHAELVMPGGSIHIKTQLLAEHSLYALLAAAAVADWHHIDPKVIKKQLEIWTPIKGRMNPLPGKHGSLLLDDTYNSSPQAAIAALDALYALDGRHIAILGSMNELGEYEAEGHRQVGAHCSRLDRLITIGRAANQSLAPAARKAGLKAKQVTSFDSPYEAGEYVAGLLKKGDVVLAKGSQNGVFAEEAVKLLLAKPSEIEQLVRQSPEWLAKKQSQFEIS